MDINAGTIAIGEKIDEVGGELFRIKLDVSICHKQTRVERWSLR